MLAFPKNSAPDEGSARARWRLLGGGIAVLTLLLVATWYAGRESAGLEEQHLSAEMQRLTQKLASAQFEVDKQRAILEQQEKALRSTGKTAEVSLQTQLRQQLLRAQAEANQYKGIVEREQHLSAENTRLLEAFANPGARLIPLRAGVADPAATAYVILVENSRLFLVASHLPAPGEGHQFQLWIIRTQDPKIVSAGSFNADSENRAFFSVDRPSLVSDISAVEVTEEPQGGSSAPGGTKVLEGVTAPVEPS